MAAGANWREVDQLISKGPSQRAARRCDVSRGRAPATVKKYEGIQPSGCSFWRLAAEGRTFCTVPENHFNCAVGADTHNIALSPDREKETAQTLKMMFDLGYVRPEEVPRDPALAKNPESHRLLPARRNAG